MKEICKGYDVKFTHGLNLNVVVINYFFREKWSCKKIYTII